MSPTLRWVLLGVVGLALAFGVGLFASDLASQEIGLAGQPRRAGEGLAPTERSEPSQEQRRDRHRSGQGKDPQAGESPATAPAPGTAAPAPSVTATQQAPSDSSATETEAPDD